MANCRNVAWEKVVCLFVCLFVKIWVAMATPLRCRFRSWCLGGAQLDRVLRPISTASDFVKIFLLKMMFLLLVSTNHYPLLFIFRLYVRKTSETFRRSFAVFPSTEKFLKEHKPTRHMVIRIFIHYAFVMYYGWSTTNILLNCSSSYKLCQVSACRN